MIAQETLLGFALNALDAAEQESVRAALADDTAAQMSLARIQRVLSPLAIDRDPIAPPFDLVAATLGKLDASLAEPRPRIGASRRWVELALAASIGLLGFGLVATGVGRFQADNARMACQNNLRTMAVGLNTYADTNTGRFPKVGTADAPVAGDFPKLLAGAGCWPNGLPQTCNGTKPVGYAYSLGHRAGDSLIGPARTDSDSVRPIAGDLPFGGPGPVSPHGKGVNVLYQDGHAIYSTVPTIGPEGDHIYQNANGQPKAGVHANDAVLGRPQDAP